MPKFLVNTNITISIFTEVEAPNKETAIEQALGRDVKRLCHQCGSDRTAHEEWVTSGELDGSIEPDEIRVEPA